jgi:O-antigen ligase
VTVIVRMLGSDPGTLFLAGRLNSPLGYVNGEGCVFAMGCWLALALSERRRPLAAGLGAAATVALACLALLSQSRGAAVSVFISVIVALIAIPGVRRRLLALAIVGAGLAAAASPIIHVYSRANGASAPPSVIHSAALAIVAASIGTGVVWALVVASEGIVRRRGVRATAVLERWATIAAVLVVLVPAGAALVRVSSIDHTIRTQWHAFVHLSDNAANAGSSGQSRLFSGGGNRYDYWRIAWHAFTGNPVAGVGAGNYTQAYFRERHTQEAIQNPHSLELQALSELGLIGGVLLALLLGGVVLGARRLRTAARESRQARAVMVAATGVAVVWLVDTSGDWMHLLPGVTAIALAAIAVLCRVGGGDAETTPSAGAARAGATARSRLPSLAVAATVAVVLAIGGASLLRAKLTQIYISSARSELAKNPAAAIKDAGRALRLDSANLDAYYVKAAGLARFDQAADARAALLAAARQDPGNFVTWVLLGDLDVRAGDIAGARVFYRRAHALDPNDPSVAALAAHPGAALNASG